MYYATVMVLTTAATVLGVMVLRIHHQVFAIIIVIVDVVVMTNHHDTRRRCHSIGLFDCIRMSRTKGPNLIFPLRLKGVNCTGISVILGTQGRRGIPVPIYLRKMAQ